jgi:hypothetical protein
MAACWEACSCCPASVSSCSKGHQQRGCTLIRPVQQHALCVGGAYMLPVFSCCSHSLRGGQQLMFSTCSSLLLLLLLLGALRGVAGSWGSLHGAGGFTLEEHPRAAACLSATQVLLPSAAEAVTAGANMLVAGSVPHVAVQLLQRPPT